MNKIVNILYDCIAWCIMQFIRRMFYPLLEVRKNGTTEKENDVGRNLDDRDGNRKLHHRHR